MKIARALFLISTLWPAAAYCEHQRSEPSASTARAKDIHCKPYALGNYRYQTKKFVTLAVGYSLDGKIRFEIQGSKLVGLDTQDGREVLSVPADFRNLETAKFFPQSQIFIVPQ